MSSHKFPYYQLTAEQELLVEKRRADYKAGKIKALPLAEFMRLVDEKKIEKKRFDK